MAKDSEEDYSAKANSTIRRWQKYKDDAEQNFESARQGLYTFFEKAVSNDKIRQKLEAELKEVRRSGGKLGVKNESGYNLVKDDYDPLVDGGDFTSDSETWKDDE
jgi:hypothetical protein